MHRSHRSLFKYAMAGIALAIACGPKPIEVPEDSDDDDDNDNGGTGATSGQGGSISGGAFSGGTFSGGAFSGGTSGTFSGGTSGTPATGGASGTPATGGVSGTPATGGVSGTPATGGVSGTPATGGTVATGGTAGAGVSGSAGTGATVACDAAFVAGADGYVRAPAAASGCWHGYAFAGGDTGSTLTTMPSFAMCATAPAPCTLRVAGTLGPATAANSYIGVVYLGFNINQAAGATAGTAIVPAGTGLQVTYTKVSGPTTIRVQIQDATTRWCAPLTTSGATIPYASFNTMCWETAPPATGAYAKQPITQVQLVAPGGETAVPIDMTLVSVKDM